MKYIKALIERINKIDEGKVFTYSDLLLPNYMQSAAAMSLSRMVAENKLKKIGKGKFYKPVYSRLGEVSPFLDELTKDILYANGEKIGYITGVPIFAQMGLTAQISSKVLIGSKKYRRPFERGGYEISFIQQKNVITEENEKLLRFLDALRLIKEIPDCTPDKAVQILMTRLSLFTIDEILQLSQLAILYSPSTRALLGAMLEQKGYTSSDLKASINPFTKYKIGISEDIMPNKSNWNIS